MLLMDPCDLPAWEALIMACTPYGHFSGGRFLADDFVEGARRSGQGAAFEEARAEAAAAVASYKLLCAEEEGAVVEEYRRAYAATVHEAAVSTMIAALKALDKLPPATEGVTDVTLDEVRGDDLDTLARKLASAAVDRDGSSRDAKVRAAKNRAASFVADFGAAVGLERVACPDDEDMLRTFYDKLSASDVPNTAHDETWSFDKVMRDAFAPYADLFSAGSLDEAAGWCRTHPEETTTLAAVGAVAIGVGIALFGLLRPSRSSRSRF